MTQNNSAAEVSAPLPSKQAAPAALSMADRVAAAVEKVRRQMDGERDRIPRHKREPWIKSYLPRQRLAMARAAIAEMAIPTDAMVRAGLDAAPHPAWDFECGQTVGIYADMIYAALEGR